MTDAERVTVESDELRRILHHYNNLTSRILTRAEVALLDGSAEEQAAALEAIVRHALDLGEFTKATRANLLGSDD